jgi:hypothetical protein
MGYYNKKMCYIVLQTQSVRLNASTKVGQGYSYKFVCQFYSNSKFSYENIHRIDDTRAEGGGTAVRLRLIAESGIPTGTIPSS